MVVNLHGNLSSTRYLCNMVSESIVRSKALWSNGYDVCFTLVKSLKVPGSIPGRVIFVYELGAGINGYFGQ